MCLLHWPPVGKWYIAWVALCMYLCTRWCFAQQWWSIATGLGVLSIIQIIIIARRFVFEPTELNPELNTGWFVRRRYRLDKTRGGRYDRVPNVRICILYMHAYVRRDFSNESINLRDHLNEIPRLCLLAAKKWKNEKIISSTAKNPNRKQGDSATCRGTKKNKAERAVDQFGYNRRVRMRM